MLSRLHLSQKGECGWREPCKWPGLSKLMADSSRGARAAQYSHSPAPQRPSWQRPSCIIPVNTIVSHACTPFPLKPTSMRRVPPTASPKAPCLNPTDPATVGPAPSLQPAPSRPSTGLPLPADPHPGMSRAPGSRPQVHRDATEPHSSSAPRPRLHASWSPHPDTRACVSRCLQHSARGLPWRPAGPPARSVTATPPSSARAPSASLRLLSRPHSAHPSVLPWGTPGSWPGPLHSPPHSTPGFHPCRSRAHSQHSSKNNPCQTHSDDAIPVLRLL